MENILYISCSARKYHENISQHQSISRMLGAQFLAEFNRSGYEVEVTHRNLSEKQPAFIDDTFIAAAFAKGTLTKEQHLILEESDEIIEEICNADIIVISSPMYNYGMPAVLKAWFDMAIRINKTFSFDLARGNKPLKPTLSGKALVLLASWGEFGFRKGESQYHLNHLSSHIEQLAPYLGAEKFYEIASEYQEFADHRHQSAKQLAIDEVTKLASMLSKPKH
ncbi:FMN-dependent NADH-azoreductase [Pseudoalteromonas piscicida]|uniref:FMN dependent NADH:quinone oxidoreductase n=1 Tax=Pseudoalteromonas piscicida TaxID=43662 RepID=A0A2A5JSR4_PSEO7|nr:NAD(P)H-dependent oxidoreductase [Pseudoalteromonas piscicida]PCK32427.1 FMN-dependent NADH-azoreductase [Pseudoalteromonas piscicida]